MDLHEQVWSRLRDNGRHHVGINGLDCSGKSTFAESFQTFLSTKGISSVILRVDDYNDRGFQKRFYQEYIDLGLGRHGVDLEDYYNDSIRYCALKSAIEDHRHDLGVTIVEGVFLFKPMLSDLFQTKVFLEVSYAEAISRYEQRKARVGDTRPLAVMTDIWIPDFELYLERCDPKGQSDVIERFTGP
ncbi:MAG: hypothetical protein AAGD07_16355 [Planctomycetota bacterium]